MIKIDKQTSNEIKVLSFICAILVIMIHASNVNIADFTNKSNVNNLVCRYIEGYFTLGVNRIAVPLFSTISGYLFFINIDKMTRLIYFKKLKSRIFSLAVPFVAWGVLGVLFYFVIQSLPLNFSFGRTIKNMNLLEIGKMIILDPIPYPTWFIRELFKVVLVTPILWFLLKDKRKMALLLVFIIWFVNFNIPFLNKGILLFFMIGSYLAINDKKLFFKFKNEILAKISTLLFFTLPILKILVEENIFASQIVDNFIIIFSLLSIDYIYNNFIAKYENILIKYSYCSIMLFFMQEPFLSCFRIVFIKLSKSNTLLLLISYFLSTAIVTLAIIIFSYIARNKMPKIYKVLSGGR